MKLKHTNIKFAHPRQIVKKRQHKRVTRVLLIHEVYKGIDTLRNLFGLVLFNYTVKKGIPI